MPNPKLARAKQTYTDEARRLAAQSMAQLEEAKVTPDALTISGVGLCIAGSVAVFFEYVGWGFYWLGAVLFVIGSVLDVLDGALARSRGIGSPFGAFLDSTVDRVGEGFMIGAIGLVLMRHDQMWGVALAFAAVAGSFLVSYARARAEALGLRGDVGLGSRAERVVVITDRARARAGPRARPPGDDGAARDHRVDHGRPADSLRPQAAS